MKIKKGTQIAHEVLEELDYILKETFDSRDVRISEGSFVDVDDLIKHIEDSRSPDGDYPDSDGIIIDLKKLMGDG